MILSINRVPITSVDQFEAPIKMRVTIGTLLMQRDEQHSIVTITLQ